MPSITASSSTKAQGSAETSIATATPKPRHIQIGAEEQQDQHGDHEQQDEIIRLKYAVAWMDAPKGGQHEEQDRHQHVEHAHPKDLEV